MPLIFSVNLHIEEPDDKVEILKQIGRSKQYTGATFDQILQDAIEKQFFDWLVEQIHYDFKGWIGLRSKNSKPTKLEIVAYRKVADDIIIDCNYPCSTHELLEDEVIETAIVNERNPYDFVWALMQ